MDNVQTVAPIIPAGTEKTVFGTTTFAQNNRQAASAPDTSKSGTQHAPAAAAGAGNAPAGNAPAGTTFQELAAKKGFQSADDLATAYNNLESQNKRVEMGLAEVLKAREEQLQSEQAYTAEELNQAQTQEQAVKVVEGLIKRHTRPLEDKLALQDLFFRNADAKQYAADIAKAVKENPGISWEAAYKIAKYDNASKEAQERGRQEAYQTIVQKQQIATDGVRGTVKSQRPLDELIRDKSIPFTEVQRIMKERFLQ